LNIIGGLFFSSMEMNPGRLKSLPSVSISWSAIQHAALRAAFQLVKVETLRRKWRVHLRHSVDHTSVSLNVAEMLASGGRRPKRAESEAQRAQRADWLKC
jgi:hypothetical protein